jgi:hypothetical protein
VLGELGWSQQPQACQPCVFTCCCRWTRVAPLQLLRRRCTNAHGSPPQRCTHDAAADPGCQRIQLVPDVLETLPHSRMLLLVVVLLLSA